MAATTPNDEEGDFVQGLDQEQLGHFMALMHALAHKSKSLRWYHHLGQEIEALRAGPNAAGHGTRWMKRLANALKISPDVLAKARRFAGEFAAPSDLAELERLKVSWTALVTSMSLGGRDEQLAFLREAADEGWSAKRLRLVVRQRLGEWRQPRTGRNPEPAADAPEVELQDLLTRARALSRYLDTRWLVGREALLPRLRQTPRRRIAATFRDLLAQAEEKLGALVRQIGRLRRGLQEVAQDGHRRGE